VGSKGDSYDNAMAEALNSLFKAELVRGPAQRRKGALARDRRPRDRGRRMGRLVHQRRLHGELGHVPPAEYEAAHWAREQARHLDPSSGASTASPAQTDPVLATTKPTKSVSTKPGA
jgi:hypothetical protein